MGPGCSPSSLPSPRPEISHGFLGSSREGSLRFTVKTKFPQMGPDWLRAEPYPAEGTGSSVPDSGTVSGLHRVQAVATAKLAVQKEKASAGQPEEDMERSRIVSVRNVQPQTQFPFLLFGAHKEDSC